MGWEHYWGVITHALSSAFPNSGIMSVYWARYMSEFPLRLADYVVFALLLAGFFIAVGRRRRREELNNSTARLVSAHEDFVSCAGTLLAALDRRQSDLYSERRAGLGTFAAAIEQRRVDLMPLVDAKVRTELKVYFGRVEDLTQGLWINVTGSMRDRSGQFEYSQMKRLVAGDKLGALYATGQSPLADLAEELRNLCKRAGVKRRVRKLIDTKRAASFDRTAQRLKIEIEKAVAAAAVPSPVLAVTHSNDDQGAQAEAAASAR